MNESPLAQQDLKTIAAHLSRKASPPWTWVFYGDSITQGAAHTHGARAFPEIFAERVRWEMQFLRDLVINAGISGHASMHLLQRDQYERRVRRFEPQAVFILVGMNDPVKVGDPEKFRERFDLVFVAAGEQEQPMCDILRERIKEQNDAGVGGSQDMVTCGFCGVARLEPWPVFVEERVETDIRIGLFEGFQPCAVVVRGLGYDVWHDGLREIA